MDLTIPVEFDIQRAKLSSITQATVTAYRGILERKRTDSTEYNGPGWVTTDAPPPPDLPIRNRPLNSKGAEMRTSHTRETTIDEQGIPKDGIV